MSDVIQKKRIITIAGRPGSGKSTASKAIAEYLGFEHYSSGDFFRAIGRERGIDVTQTNQAATSDAEIDRLVDERQTEMGRTQDRVVIDGRMSWHFVPQSFKVYLDLDLEVAARRILANMDPVRKAHEHVPDDPKQYAEALRHRLSLERARYDSKYGVDISDPQNFDLIVDTGAINPQQVMDTILAAYNKWLSA
ncbi:MAG TPA: nucleoside monophosphate kinase [Candidatus Saccharimonadales bacterium]|nr:nucleoside monophosphate kinase [Candidatus Saccharimonadales bacterium]